MRWFQWMCVALVALNLSVAVWAWPYGLINVAAAAVIAFFGYQDYKSHKRHLARMAALDAEHAELMRKIRSGEF